MLNRGIFKEHMIVTTSLEINSNRSREHDHKCDWNIDTNVDLPIPPGPHSTHLLVLVSQS